MQTTRDDLMYGTPEQLAKCDLLEIKLVFSPIMRVYMVFCPREDKWLRTEMVERLGKWAPGKAAFVNIDKAIETAARLKNDKAWWY